VPLDNQYLYERGFTCSSQGGSPRKKGEGGMTLREVMQCSLDTPITQKKSDTCHVELALK
jgi:hypothetical protein